MKTGICLLLVSLFMLVGGILFGVIGVHESHYLLPDGSVAVMDGASNPDMVVGGEIIEPVVYDDNEALSWVCLAGWMIFSIGGVVFIVANSS